jgi:hypothetical protein
MSRTDVLMGKNQTRHCDVGLSIVVLLYNCMCNLRIMKVTWPKLAAELTVSYINEACVKCTVTVSSFT